MQKSVRCVVSARRHARRKRSPGRKRHPRPLIWKSASGAGLASRRVSSKRSNNTIPLPLPLTGEGGGEGESGFPPPHHPLPPGEGRIFGLMGNQNKLKIDGLAFEVGKG